MFANSPETVDWAIWAGLIGRHCLDYKVTDVMRDPVSIVSGKDCFMVTTNGEDHFTTAEFDESRVCELEGDWRMMKCAHRCHDTVYPSLGCVSDLRHMVVDGEVPVSELSRCPRCDGSMRIRMQADGSFLPDRKAEPRLAGFIERNSGGRIVALELGTGIHNRVIKLT